MAVKERDFTINRAPGVEEKRKNLHIELQQQLMGEIFPGWSGYSRFLVDLGRYFSKAEQYACEENVRKVFDILETKGCFGVGNYGDLREILKGENETAVQLIDKFQKQIDALQVPESADIDNKMLFTKDEFKRKRPDKGEECWIYTDSTECLGEGCLGTIVYRGWYQSRDVAVKRISNNYFNLIDRETEALLKIDKQENILQFYHKERDTKYTYIVLELAKGTLRDIVDGKLNISLTEKDIYWQILNGLRYLHRCKLVHRDVKPDNVLLVDRGDKDIATLGDFGLCKTKTVGRNSMSLTYGSTIGTFGYIAPEIAGSKAGDRITEKVDVFSAGITMFYYFGKKGNHPFQNPTGKKCDYTILQQYICDGKEQYLDELDSHGERLLRDLLTQMIERNPCSRLSASASQTHIYFWPYRKQIAFIQYVSDSVIPSACKQNAYAETVSHQLEVNAQRIIGNGWLTTYDTNIQRDLQRKGNHYETKEVKGLLRSIRNLTHHIDTQSAATKQIFGREAEHQIKYIETTFPEFLFHLYMNVKAFLFGLPQSERGQNDWLKSLETFF